MIGAVSSVHTGAYPALPVSAAPRPAPPSEPVEASQGPSRPAGAPSVETHRQPAPSDSKSAVESQALSEEEQARVDELKSVDREIRAHEQAHKSAGGQYAGSASFEYQKGPDGKRYAVGGEVPIDAAPVEGDPAATIEKMDQIISAALAPAEPSAQDRKVAAQARAAKNKAQAELNAGQAEQGTSNGGPAKSGAEPGTSQVNPGISAYQTAGNLAVPASVPEISFAI
ncbi:putative metalloprotease CJM1_0395 family protein [Emcibacter sp.]|uniref:putative metalloprotease CJM1_0395 family protein n=1 Tax=Emcibacter sp. TaxID=1979954 RepID=UPI002AA5FDE0|nr:putative metalloprotease CJM1_0395 family protein [Emcibacter sp.]